LAVGAFTGIASDARADADSRDLLYGLRNLLVVELALFL